MTDCRTALLGWVVPDMSPYHHARIAAYARHFPAAVVEISDTSEFAEFKHAADAPRAYRHQILIRGRRVADVSTSELSHRVNQALDEVEPDVLLVPGWSEPFALASLAWARRTGTPVVVASETQAIDHERAAWREWVKRRIVGQFEAGLVGGRTHRDYLVKLGMPSERIFEGYDVVDNRHFAEGADTARANAASLRRKLNLPPRFFLASARFVPKKNLAGLLAAFAAYVRQTQIPWHLVLLGDGRERPALERLRSQLNLDAYVHMPGFRGYQELPVYYGLAGAFVHASRTEQWGLVVNEALAAGLPVIVSNRCGCCPELVHDGRNGLTFDPDHGDQLTRCLMEISNHTPDLPALGRESRRIISDWTPERFAGGLHAAIQSASGRTPANSTRWTEQLLIWAVSRRARQPA
jgi:glycosyltransferase involved in cell wall biosynthesis